MVSLAAVCSGSDLGVGWVVGSPRRKDFAFCLLRLFLFAVVSVCRFQVWVGEGLLVAVVLRLGGRRLLASCCGPPRLRYQVQSGSIKVDVNLDTGTCTCRFWQLKGILCMHACSAITHQSRRPEDYCHALLSIGAYNSTYEFFVNPTASQEYWEKTEYAKPVPPPSRRSAERQKKQRRKDGNKASVSGGKSKRIYNEWTCSNCNMKGHSSRGPVQQQILSQEAPNIVETSGHRQEGKTYGLRGPVVYPNSFGVRPPFPHQRGAAPAARPPFPQQRGAAPAAGQPLPQQRGAAPLKRVLFPMSGLDTNEPDLMYFIPNQVMHPDYPK
ncbi:hypothetical protein QL285_043034 [Trifolium repens]|nr:hypothetical protein QL285_043034 [Trifolium repens]